MSHTEVCAAPSGGVFAPVWSENGYTLYPFGLESRVWFSSELREYMNVFIVSIPNELERKRNMRIRNRFELFFFCLRPNLSNGNIISAYRPGLKTVMDIRGLFWKRVWIITFFGVKSGQDLKNRAAHPRQEFPGVAPRGIKHDSVALIHATKL